MSTDPMIETKATYAAPRLTLADLAAFLDALADWPRDTEVVVHHSYGQRDQLERVTLTATQRGAK